MAARRMINPATNPEWKHVWDFSLESYGDGVAIDSVNDSSARALNKDLSATGADRPIYQTNELNGYGIARFGGAARMSGGAAADWIWLHDATAWSAFVVFKTAAVHQDTQSALFSTSNNGSTASTGMVIWLDDRSSVSRRHRVIHGHVDSSGSGVGIPSTQDYAYQDMRWNVLGLRWTVDSRGWEDSQTLQRRLIVTLNGIPAQTTDLITIKTTYPTGNPSTILNMGCSGTTPTAFFVGDMAYLALADAYFMQEDWRAYERYLHEYFDIPHGGLIDEGRTFNVVPCIAKTAHKIWVCEYARRRHDNFTANDHIVQKRSGNRGWDWSTSRLQLYLEGKVAQNVGLFTTSSGALLRGYTEWLNSTPDVESYIQRSTNDGETWSAAVGPNSGIGGNTDQILGFTQVAGGGAIFLGAYGKINAGDAFISQRVVKSTDDGATWGSPVTVINGVTASANYIEGIPLCLASGDILFFLRNNTAVDIELSRSTDGGATWGAVSTLFNNHNGTPKAIQTAAGNIFVLARWFLGANQDGYVLYWSDDNGTTWSTTPYYIDCRRGNAALADIIEIEPGIILTATASAYATLVNAPSMELVRYTLHREVDILNYT